MNLPSEMAMLADVPVHVYDLCEVPMPDGPGFYYNIPLDADTGEYVPPGRDEPVYVGPFETAYLARDAAFAFVNDIVRGLNAEEANFDFVTEADLANMQTEGTA